MRAYVVVTVGPGKAREVARQIASISGVRAANACWGVPDIFVVAEVARTDDLNELVNGKIRLLEGVQRTETHMAVE